jgi:hypothetical protein
VYFAGDRDLSEAMLLSLKQLYRAGRGRGCNVVAQFNPVDSPPRRFQIEDLDVDGRLGRLGRAIPCAGKTLESFVTCAIGENPSDHYLLILSGHGSGVVGKRTHEPGFAPGAARTLDLGPILESVRRSTGRVVDVLGIDACFMSMCEVCWELRGAVRFLVASEGLAPQYGWPYHRILELFRDDRVPVPREVASAIVGRYLRYRSDFDLAGQSVDLSACDVDKTNRLAKAVRRLSRAMEARLRDRAFRDALVLSHWKAQSYKSEQYVDLWDFCDLLEEHSGAARSQCQAVKSAISDRDHGVVEKSVFHGPGYQHSHGLSIYFPWSSVSPQYRNHRFAEATGWLDFLTKYVGATRREMRGVPRRAAS